MDQNNSGTQCFRVVRFRNSGTEPDRRLSAFICGSICFILAVPAERGQAGKNAGHHRSAHMPHSMDGPRHRRLPGGARTDVEAQRMLARGENPYPVHLERPVAAPLSAMARSGARVFFDASLSSSGKPACASCHSPANGYGPPGDLPAVDAWRRYAVAAGCARGAVADVSGTAAQFQRRSGQRRKRNRQPDADWRRGAKASRAGRRPHRTRRRRRPIAGAAGRPVLGRACRHAAGPGDGAVAQSAGDGRRQRGTGGGEAAPGALCAGGSCGCSGRRFSLRRA